jgi:hypothetical protein
MCNRVVWVLCVHARQAIALLVPPPMRSERTHLPQHILYTAHAATRRHTTPMLRAPMAVSASERVEEGRVE